MRVGRIAPDGQGLKQFGPIAGGPARNVQKIGGGTDPPGHPTTYSHFLLGRQVAKPLGHNVRLYRIQQAMNGGQQMQNKRVRLWVDP